ncbi:type II toxin-antitoxin system RelE/ParE family toxin [Patescibacteria group bacterium]|nr:type II toxin-antitoxin system RelE/ParE family toxin [Patescibacteria group bacterium]MBU4023155.1 type II toxin-antitoxin system RelE/ParE family toxin [Patescibacteria group bacterium]
MDKIDKILNQLSQKEREKIKDTLSQIDNNNFENLDLKKLKDREDLFRVRKGSLRIIFRKIDNSIKILAIEHRSSKTYKNLSKLKSP